MAEPKIVSFLERGIRIENIREGIPVCIFERKGIPFSIKIEMDTIYLKKKPTIEYYIKDSDYVKNVILKDKKLIKLISELKESFFSTESAIYAFYDEGHILVYDVMTNTNFFPFCDLEKISVDYNYIDSGFEVLKPVLSGYKKYDEVISFLGEYIKSKEGNKVGNLFTLPMYPELSSPTYFFYDEPPLKGYEAKNEEFEIITVAEKEKEKDTELPELPVVTAEEEKKKYKTAIATPDFTKNLKNIRDYIEASNIHLEKMEYVALPHLALLWSYWCGYTNMNVISDYVEIVMKEDLLLRSQLLSETERALSKVFYRLWCDIEGDLLGKLNKNVRECINPDFIHKVLKLELVYYVEAYEAVYGFLYSIG